VALRGVRSATSEPDVSINPIVVNDGEVINYRLPQGVEHIRRGRKQEGVSFGSENPCDGVIAGFKWAGPNVFYYVPIASSRVVHDY
jgi:hypothetical protein